MMYISNTCKLQYTLFLEEPVNSELRLAVLNFLRFLASIVLNLFLIFIFLFASSLNKLFDVFVCARAAESCSCT